MSAQLPSQQPPVTLPAAHAPYEAPLVVASFPKGELLDALPEDLAPHIHTIQDS